MHLWSPQYGLMFLSAGRMVIALPFMPSCLPHFHWMVPCSSLFINSRKNSGCPFFFFLLPFFLKSKSKIYCYIAFDKLYLKSKNQIPTFNINLCWIRCMKKISWIEEWKIKDGEKSGNKSRHLVFHTEKLARTSSMNLPCWNISIHSFLILYSDFLS